jgi:hypothetical protein
MGVSTYGLSKPTLVLALAGLKGAEDMNAGFQNECLR